MCDANDAHERGIDNRVLRVASYLLGPMQRALRGTRTGLTSDRIEEIRQGQITEWGHLQDPDSESSYLDAHPELAKTVHDCTLRIQVGQCALRQAR